MYASIQLIKSSLTAAECQLLAEAVLRIASGATVSSVYAALGPTLMDPYTSVVQDVEEDRWTRTDNMLTSPCAAPCAAKTKSVTFTGTAINSLNMIWGDGVTSITDVLAISSGLSRITVVVTPRSIFVGNYVYNSTRTAGGFVLCSEFTVRGNSSHYTESNLLPVMSTNITLASLSTTTAVTFKIFNRYVADGTVASNQNANAMVGDTLVGSWSATNTAVRVAQHSYSDNLSDALLPFGLHYAGSSTIRGFAASVTDHCGIYYYAGMGTSTSTMNLCPDDTLRLPEGDFIMFGKFAVPLK